MTRFFELPALRFAAVCLIVWIVLSSCSGGDGGRGGSRDAPMEHVGADSVRAYIGLREMGYAALEPVPMRLVVKNVSGRTLRLTFPTAQRFDFVVEKDRRPVWSWSEGRAFAQLLKRLVLAPGDSLVYEHAWNGKLADGRTPRLGRYSAKGMLMTLPPVQTGEKQFGIVD